MITVSIDVELAKLLKKEKNYSAIINGLLWSYFNIHNIIEQKEETSHLIDPNEIDKEMGEAGI